MFPDPNTIADPMQRANELRRQAEVKRKAAHEMRALAEPLPELLRSPVERLGDHLNVWSSRKAKAHASEGRDWLQKVRRVHTWIEEEAARLDKEAAAQEAEADVVSRTPILPS